MVILLAGVAVAIASILRLAYLIHRFYEMDIDLSFTEFQVNLISTIELDLTQFRCCLPVLKPFMRQYMPNALRLNSFAANTNQRSNKPAPSSLHPSKAGRKWPNGSLGEELIGSNYLELGEDGKSDQSYVMAAMPVRDGK